jgi:hypothetical protein
VRGRGPSPFHDAPKALTPSGLRQFSALASASWRPDARSTAKPPPNAAITYRACLPMLSAWPGIPFRYVSPEENGLSGFSAFRYFSFSANATAFGHRSLAGPLLTAY